MAWLKRDVTRRHPELRFAFSRPGLYTFKLANAVAEHFRLDTPFARHWGYSLGTAIGAAEVAELVRTGLPAGSRRPRLFIASRDEGPDSPLNPRVDALGRALLAADPALFEPGVTPRVGDWVVDVVVPMVDTEPCFVGCHQHDEHYGKVPGGITRVNPPESAPSRAYSKLQEALAWSELPIKAGDQAVEVGCAPGGAVAALLERGVHVTGIDPADMSPQLTTKVNSGSFVHKRCAVGELERDDLPERVDWLLCDANLAPQTALRYLSRLSKWLRPHLRALVFTVKLNDERVVDSLPQILEGLRRLSGANKSVRAVQLPSHRREVVAIVRF